MRLYVTPSGRWAGTQADAVKIAREADTGRWSQAEVPTDKPGLLDWLDQRRVRLDDSPAAVEPDLEPIADVHPIRPAAPVDAERELRRAERIAQSRDVDALIAWLEEADQWQVERIFEMLGARFAEIIRARKAA